MGYCGHFLSNPDEISVKVGERTRVHRDPLPAVKIRDPKHDYGYALMPDQARKMANRIETNAETRECIRLAEDIRTIADRVEQLQ